jgi:MFS family permease
VDRKFRPQSVNFWCHVVEGALAMLAFQLVSGAEVLPVLVTDELGFSRVTLGWVHSIIQASFLLPLLVSPLLETGGRRKRLVMALGVGQRLPLALIAVGLALFAGSADTYGIVVGIIAVALLIQAISARLNGGPWTDLIAETIPEDRHSRLWGRRNMLGAAMRLLAAPLSLLVLRELLFPGNYITLYLLAFGLAALSWLVFGMVDDVPEHVPEQTRRPFGQYYRELARDLRADGNFRLYLAFAVLRGLGATVFVFFAVEAVKVHAMDKAFVIFSLMLGRNAVRMASSWVSPYVAERVGYKRLIAIGSFFTMVAAITAAYTPVGWGWLFLAGTLTWSLGGSARAVGAQSYRLRLLPRGRRVGYQALLGTATAITAIVAMPVMGAIMEHWGHTIGFTLGGLISFSCCLPLVRCRARDTAEPEAPAGTA